MQAIFHRREDALDGFAIRFRNGDEAAFERLYDSLAPSALRVAAGILHSDAEAADAVQEAFLRVYRAIGTYRIDAPFAPWFYKILINESRRILSQRVNSEPLENAYYIPANTEDALSIQVRDALDRLEPNQRMAVVLKYITGYSEKEIAQILGLSVSAVKSRLLRGRHSLKVLLTEVDADE